MVAITKSRAKPHGLLHMILRVSDVHGWWLAGLVVALIIIINALRG